MASTLTLADGRAGAARAPQVAQVTQVAPAVRTAAPELFVVSTHKVRDRGEGACNSWLPYGTQHAWTPGSRQTLCGQWTNGWTVFWGRHFSARPASACPVCVEATLPEDSRRRLDPRPRASG